MDLKTCFMILLGGAILLFAAQARAEEKFDYLLIEVNKNPQLHQLLDDGPLEEFGDVLWEATFLLQQEMAGEPPDRKAVEKVLMKLDAIEAALKKDFQLIQITRARKIPKE